MADPTTSPETASTTDPADPGAISDPQRIRALAHPLRIRLLDILSDEDATASRCSEVTGESVASCSFHLRTLAKYGFIEPAEPRGREKPWRLLARTRTITPDWNDPASVRAVQEFAALDLEQEMARLLNWVHRSNELPMEWVEATTITSATVWVTREELEQLSAAVNALTAPYRGRRQHPETRPDGARKAHLFAATTAEVDGTSVPAPLQPTDHPPAQEHPTGDQP